MFALQLPLASEGPARGVMRPGDRRLASDPAPPSAANSLVEVASRSKTPSLAMPSARGSRAWVR